MNAARSSVGEWPAANRGFVEGRRLPDDAGVGGACSGLKRAPGAPAAGSDQDECAAWNPAQADRPAVEQPDRRWGSRLCCGSHSRALCRFRSPTLAAEKLAEYDGLMVSRETLRRWMTEAGIWLSLSRNCRLHPCTIQNLHPNRAEIAITALRKVVSSRQYFNFSKLCPISSSAYQAII
jgi:hypothetical protein